MTSDNSDRFAMWEQDSLDLFPYEGRSADSHGRYRLASCDIDPRQGVCVAEHGRLQDCLMSRPNLGRADRVKMAGIFASNPAAILSHRDPRLRITLCSSQEPLSPDVQMGLAMDPVGTVPIRLLRDYPHPIDDDVLCAIIDRRDTLPQSLDELVRRGESHPYSDQVLLHLWHAGDRETRVWAQSRMPVALEAIAVLAG